MHEGHRQRLINRFGSEGFESFAEHEILEFLLFFALPRVDTNPIAHRLIKKFGSLSGVLEADPKDLEQISGIGKKASAFLSVFPHAFRAYEQSKLGKKPTIISIKDACEFARSLLFGKPFEQFYMIWLNTQNRVIHYERLSEGSVCESPVYLGKIAAAALRHHAVKCVIAHNHPGGSVSPSSADIRTTQDILSTLHTLGIDLLDHIIICDNEAFSFQADSLIERDEFSVSKAYAAEYSCMQQFNNALNERLK